MAKILITGGSGMIGQVISKRLLENGHQIVHLSRSPSQGDQFKTFKWEPQKGVIDESAFDGVEIIIHLAGASITQRWSPKNKQTIINSRVDTAKLLLKYVKRLNSKLKTFISASGIGYYGGDTGNELLTEDSPLGADFIADVVDKWEGAADEFKEICPVVKLRIGIVLSNNGGALPQIALPVRYGVGAAIGSGNQYMSWIHIDDLAEVFALATTGKMKGVYNAVSSQPETNEHFTKIIAQVLSKPFFLPNIPKLFMKLYFGEMSILVTGGNRVSNAKLVGTGFEFKYNELKPAIKDLLS